MCELGSLLGSLVLTTMYVLPKELQRKCFSRFWLNSYQSILVFFALYINMICSAEYGQDE